MEQETRFGARLRIAREAAGLSIGGLAKKLDITEGAIRQMESGQTKSATLANGVLIARVLNVSPAFLAGLTEEMAGGSEVVPKIPDPSLTPIEQTLEAIAERRVSKGLPETGADSAYPKLRSVDHPESIENQLAGIREEFRREIADTNRSLEAALQALRQEIRDAQLARAPRRKPS